MEVVAGGDAAAEALADRFLNFGVEQRIEGARMC